MKQIINNVEHEIRSFAELDHANLLNAALGGAELISASMKQANLKNSYLDCANLTGANLTCANLTGSILRNANLTGADLTCADLTNADLTNADLTNADLTNAVLESASLRGTNLSGVKGLTKASDFLKQFKQTRSGIYVYKAILRTTYKPNPNWVIKPGSYLEENVNGNLTDSCGCGINFASLEWIRFTYPYSNYWLCLIEWKDAADIVVPYNTDGKARCSRLKLIKLVG